MIPAAMFIPLEPNRSASQRLFCFPFAGGGVATYRPWLQFLRSDIELVAVQLPGRGSLLAQRPFDTMSDLVAELVFDIDGYLDKPSFFFGHSLGSKIAFEVAWELHCRGWPLPRHFFASGSGAPFLPRTSEIIHRLSDDEFIAHVRSLKGAPEVVLGNDELMHFMLPMMRADFKLVETYLGSRSCVLPTALTLLGGEQDEVVSREDLLAWQQVFSSRCTVRTFSGGHFFINDHAAEIVSLINEVGIVRDADIDPAVATRV